MNYKLLLIAIVSIVFACNEAENHNSREAAAKAEKSPADSLYDLVDKLHMEGMAKAGKLKIAIGQTQKALDSLAKLPAKKIDKVYQQSLTELKEELSYADNAMFTWMTEFKDSFKDNEQRVKYLQAEKEKVTKVRDNILHSLQRADSLLKK